VCSQQLGNHPVLLGDLLLEFIHSPLHLDTWLVAFTFEHDRPVLPELLHPAVEDVRIELVVIADVRDRHAVDDVPFEHLELLLGSVILARLASFCLAHV